MNLPRRRALLGLLGATPLLQASVRPLRLLTGDVPPLCDERDGLLNAPVRALAQAVGHAEAIAHYPWPRALDSARSLGRSLIYPLGRSPDREPHWHWLQPLAVDELALLVRRDALPGLERLPAFSALPRLRVGGLRGALLTQVLQAEGQHEIVHGPDERAHARLLGAGRLQAWAANRSVIAHLMRQQHLEVKDFHPPLVRFHVPLYLAATLDCSATELARWRRTPVRFTPRLW